MIPRVISRPLLLAIKSVIGTYTKTVKSFNSRLSEHLDENMAEVVAYRSFRKNIAVGMLEAENTSEKFPNYLRYVSDDRPSLAY